MRFQRIPKNSYEDLVVRVVLVLLAPILVLVILPDLVVLVVLIDLHPSGKPLESPRYEEGHSFQRKSY